VNINAPLFVLTSDTDWASEACIQDVAALAERFRIKPVFFATHQSDTLARLQRDGAADVGVHPNFRPGSTHGADVETVIDHVFRLYPGARSYRCHGFVDSFEIAERMRERGVVHDSNLCLDMQADIRPLHHALDIFVQSSDYEGTPNAVLEAMALETPVVATAAGGTAEVAEHVAHALVVPTGDVPSLVAAIHRTLMSPQEAAARVTRARRQVETALSFATRMAAVDSIYESAAATRALRPVVAVAGRCA